MNLGMLADLQVAFQEEDVDNSGTLDIDEFKMVVKHAMKIACRVRIPNWTSEQHKLTYL